MGPLTAAEPGGSARFFRLAQLGEGGNGVVYRALDLVLGVEVAVKVLARSSGRDLYRFKREFRALAEVMHPNLVRLYELFVHDDQWSFSMELVDGVPLRDHLRRRATTITDDGGTSPFDDEAPTRTGPTGELPGGPARPGAPLGDGPLADVFAQLADAVMAIHATGKIHRDLKPSNVLVEPGGRVVVLDFGLVSDADPDDVERTHEAMAVGTPAYMSPEQAMDRPLTPASDWYAVGVMLYEALTGVRPFDGPAVDTLRRRTREDPRPPRDLAPAVPVELERLCLALLDRDPARRADGAAILATFGRAATPPTMAIERLGAGLPFDGRRAELDALADGLARAADGVAVFMPVTGPSGIGKTTLIRHFLDGLDPARTLVLHGRCYERETVPFQAIDSLVDAVATRLATLAPAAIEALLPRDIAALARLFPTLNRVPAIVAPHRRAPLPPDLAEVRRRAVAAFAELLERLAGARTLVVFLDDLQWSDADAGAVLAELVRGFEDIGALFVVASRSAEQLLHAAPTARDDRATPTVRIASDTEPASPRALTVRELAIGPMPADDVTALVAAVGRDG
ncbi:MAG: serine/threonine-protein kinase PknK, partial [Myxococcales bacterium]|nr:serine/threonine-protein kinase PknK [Myxococcales bacterium]